MFWILFIFLLLVAITSIFHLSFADITQKNVKHVGRQIHERKTTFASTECSFPYSTWWTVYSNSLTLPCGLHFDYRKEKCLQSFWLRNLPNQIWLWSDYEGQWLQCTFVCLWSSGLTCPCPRHTELCTLWTNKKHKQQFWWTDLWPLASGLR